MLEVRTPGSAPAITQCRIDASACARGRRGEISSEGRSGADSPDSAFARSGAASCWRGSLLAPSRLSCCSRSSRCSPTGTTRTA